MCQSIKERKITIRNLSEISGFEFWINQNNLISRTLSWLRSILFTLLMLCTTNPMIGLARMAFLRACASFCSRLNFFFLLQKCQIYFKQCHSFLMKRFQKGKVNSIFKSTLFFLHTCTTHQWTYYNALLVAFVMKCINAQNKAYSHDLLKLYLFIYQALVFVGNFRALKSLVDIHMKNQVNKRKRKWVLPSTDLFCSDFRRASSFCCSSIAVCSSCNRTAALRKRTKRTWLFRRDGMGSLIFSLTVNLLSFATSYDSMDCISSESQVKGDHLHMSFPWYLQNSMIFRGFPGVQPGFPGRVGTLAYNEHPFLINF